jgi:hypothetical protein
VDRRDVHDASAILSPRETLDKTPTGKKRAIKISAEDAIKLGQGHLLNRCTAHVEACGIDEPPHRPKRLLCDSEKCIYLRLVSDVGPLRERLSTCRFDRSDDPRRSLLVVKVGDHNSSSASA